MSTNFRIFTSCICFTVSAILLNSAHAAENPSKKSDQAAQISSKTAAATSSPSVAGLWVGDWGPYNPAQGLEVDDTKCKAMECQVTRQGDTWQATFEGECGRPYKFTVSMEGRQVGNVVMFKGSPDLGPKDGGQFDWIGRATDKEFSGFYTAENYTGFFTLERPVVVPERKQN